MTDTPWSHPGYVATVAHQGRLSMFRLNRHHRNTPIGCWIVDRVPAECSLFEVGYGGGGFARWASPRVREYGGIDLADESLRSGGLADSRFLVGDFMEVDLPHYDVVVADNVIHHFSDPWAGIRKTIGMARRDVLLGLKGILRPEDHRATQQTPDGIEVPFWLLSIPKLVAFAMSEGMPTIHVRLRPLAPHPFRSISDSVYPDAVICDVLLSRVPCPERIQMEYWYRWSWRKWKYV